MFIGASLNPEYFKEKINLFIALAPVASTEHMSNKKFRLIANHIDIFEFLVVNVLHIYNWWPNYHNLLGLGGSYSPAGQTYRASVYYSQSVNGSYRFNLYDYGKFKNKKVYGQDEPPVVPLDAFDLPTALQSGSKDKLATPEDVAWLTEQLGDKVVFNQ